MFKLPNMFFSPDDIGGSTASENVDTLEALFGESGDASEQEEIDLFVTPDSKEKAKKETKEDDDEEEETTELTEEDLVVQTVPRKKEILAAYPDIFKKFPAIEAAIYRDRQFTELFPTPADAQESVDKAVAFDNLKQSIFESGKSKEILGSIKDEDPEVFKQVVDNLLVDLHEVDKEAYFHVIGTVASDLIYKMVQLAKSKNNESVGIAAQILNQVVFGTDEYVPAQKLAKQLQKDDSVAKEREELNRTKFDDAITDVSSRTDNLILKGIDAMIDKEGAMTPYVKKIAVKEAFDECHALIAKDKAFITVMNGMWKRAVANGLQKDGLDKIKSAYLSKAKTVLPKLITKARNNAYQGMGKNVRVNREERGIVSPGKSATHTNSGKSTTGGKKEIPAGMSSADYLLSDD